MPNIKNKLILISVSAFVILYFHEYWPSQMDPTFVVYGQTPTGGVPPNRTPGLFELTPSSAPAGSGDLTITLRGQDFVTSSYVRVNGGGMNLDLRTSYVSPTQLTALLPAATLQSGGPLFFTVLSPSVTGGYYSLSLPFTILAPSPVITGMIPASGAPGTTFTARINGTNLTGVSSVQFSGTGVGATAVTGATTSVPFVQVTVARDASPGPRSVSISGTGGTTTAAGVFVVQSPKIATEPPLQPLPIGDVEQAL